MKDIAVAVIGLGTMGGRYAEALAGGRFAGAQLGSVCDVDAARTEAASARFGVPAFASAEAWRAARRPDAAYVATPDRQHREPAVALAGAGVPLLVEKPRDDRRGRAGDRRRGRARRRCRGGQLQQPLEPALRAG